MTANGKAARRLLGVTGGLGCGKTEVGKILMRLGWAVCDADDLARAALAPGGTAFDAVVAQFGRGILDRDGSVDRARLAAIVFNDANARAALNAIVHPQVRRMLQDWLEGPAAGVDAAAVVPLLFEAGWDEGWTATVCVAARPEVVSERLQRQRGWSEAEIRRRMAAQWPLEEKQKRADYIIENNGSLEALEAQVRRLSDLIRTPGGLPS